MRHYESWVLAFVLVLGGCAGGPSPEESGMRAWVDERGQVRYRSVEDEKRGMAKNEQDASGKDAGASAEKSPTHPVYNLENFPAAEETVKEDEQLYYTWRDAEGRVHNTPYSLSEEKVSRVSTPETKQKASSARITRKDDAGAPDYNPSAEAKQILGLEDAAGRLDLFAENCCSTLPRIETFRLTSEQGVGISLNEEDHVHRFSTGESRFALIRIPRDQEGSLLRVRSFIRDGAFVPNMVFLDGDFEPVRLVTDIAFEFSPETWSRYGFLEALVPLDAQPSERWLVVFTREQDLGATTTITQGDGDRTIVDHSPTGSLKLTIP